MYLGTASHHKKSSSLITAQLFTGDRARDTARIMFLEFECMRIRFDVSPSSSRRISVAFQYWRPRRSRPMRHYGVPRRQSHETSNHSIILHVHLDLHMLHVCSTLYSSNSIFEGYARSACITPYSVQRLRVSEHL